MDSSDTGRPAPESGRAVGLVEPIWRYQDACAIDMLLDEPARGRHEDELGASERRYDALRIRRLRAG